MRHTRVLAADGLEPRRLLTHAHHPAAHLVHAEVVAPITLDGTLAVNQKAATATQDDIGDTVVTTPVVGVLGGVGKVQGAWTESADAMGDPLSDDTIQLHNAQGSFTLSFSPTGHGKTHATGKGEASFKPLSQRVTGGAKAYAHAAETGLILVNTNASGNVVQSMTLTSNPA